MDKFFSFIVKYRNAILHGFLLAFILISLGILFSKGTTRTFFYTLEDKTFDVRQVMLSEHKSTSKDIVIVTVDDSSYEYLLSHYGEWPVPREIYAEFADYVEAQNPLLIAFDLLFVKSLRSKPGSDQKLVEAFKKYDNIFTAINFDDQSKDDRMPPPLPLSLTSNVKVESKIFNPYLFTNCRTILEDIIAVTSNIGHINTPKSEDGIHRMAPLFITYPRYNPIALNYRITEYDEVDYYPNMTLKVALKYFEEKENIKIDSLTVDKDNNLVFNNKKIKMGPNGDVILNWYGPSGLRDGNTFTYIPFWKVIESINAKKAGKQELLQDGIFKDKVVYVGTSVMSLSDIKMVPTEKYFPGVELHTTLLNNIIDNSIIQKLHPAVDISITILLAMMVAFAVYYLRSILASLIATSSIIVIYLFITYYVMLFFNIWMWIIVPVVSCVLTFVVMYLVKYIIKSKDLEYTYKLATTDGLTDLYNHRFFQEQMIMNVEYSKRAGTSFSLILIDIDYFKKFNDKYGHQAGDAVLRQVAQVLKKAVRGSDIVFRYGGEEMAIILRDTNKEEATIAAQKICNTVAQHEFRLNTELEQCVTISLGVATYPQDGEIPSELIEYADKGLYNAKGNGRNQVGKVF